MTPPTARCCSTRARATAPRRRPAQDNCWFVSAVDNGWYASGLIEVRQALPALRGLADALLAPMDFAIFYDNRAQTDCNTNACAAGNPPTGQMYGGYYVDQGPAGYHNGALYSDPRIAMYMGMGRHQMPGDVWWRTWRTLPPQRAPPTRTSRPRASGRCPATGTPTPTRSRASSSRSGRATTPIPGTSLDVRADVRGRHVRGADGQPGRARDDLGHAQLRARRPALGAGPGQRTRPRCCTIPVWGISPSSTADDTGNYGGFGVEGQAFARGRGRWRCARRARPRRRSARTPRRSRCRSLPQQAYANLRRCGALYPGIYTADGGFYDAVNPTTGSVGHRRLVLDQSMIMAAIDDALNEARCSATSPRDPVSWAARLYLSRETMSIS